MKSGTRDVLTHIVTFALGVLVGAVGGKGCPPVPTPAATAQPAPEAPAASTDRERRAP